MVSSGRVPRLCSSAVLFFRVSPATTREDGDGETRGGERERLHITGEDGETRSLNRRVSVTPRKSLQSSFYLGQPGSRQRRRRVSSGFCVIVSLLIKVKGVSWIFSPLHFFIRHLLLSSGGNVKRLEPVPTAYYLKSARCDPADVPPALILAAFTRKTTALFAFTAPRTLLVFLFLDATGTIVNYSRSKFLERRFSFSVLWR